MLLKSSVGKKGVNKKADVKLIQEALNRTIRIPYALLKVDGIAGATTCLAIERFQQNVLGLKNPDGCVDAGGKTWDGLKKYLIDTPLQRFSIYSIFAVTNNSKSTPVVTNKKIAWGAKVSASFKVKVNEICDFLDLAPDYLVAPEKLITHCF